MMSLQIHIRFGSGYCISSWGWYRICLPWPAGLSFYYIQLSKEIELKSIILYAVTFFLYGVLLSHKTFCFWTTQVITGYLLAGSAVGPGGFSFVSELVQVIFHLGRWI
jgi:hypothetical protein